MRTPDQLPPAHIQLSGTHLPCQWSSGAPAFELPRLLLDANNLQPLIGKTAKTPFFLKRTGFQPSGVDLTREKGAFLLSPACVWQVVIVIVQQHQDGTRWPKDRVSGDCGQPRPRLVLTPPGLSNRRSHGRAFWAWKAMPWKTVLSLCFALYRLSRLIRLVKQGCLLHL
jgi:hypothetical protein